MPGEAWITQGARAVRGVEVFVELVGELAVVAGFGDLVPRWRMGCEEGIAGAKPVIEEFTRWLRNRQACASKPIRR